MEKFIPNAPLFQDPIYDGAADPVVIWNRLYNFSSSSNQDIVYF